MNFLHNFRKRSELQPGVPALIDHCFSGDRVVSYSSLNKLADYLSIELREQKIKVGDRVLLALDSGQELYGYLLATLQIGAMPIIYQQDGSHQEYVAWVKSLGPHAVVIRRERWVGCHFDSAFKHIPKKIYIGQVRSQARWLRLGKLGAVEERDPDSPAVAVLTGDAAGKLSMRSWSQKQLDLSIQFYLSHLKLKAGEIDLCQTPLQFLTNLSAGLTSVFAEGSGLLALAKVERRIEKFKPTRIAGESALIRRLLRKYSSPLHKVFITDAPLDAESIDFFKRHVQHANIELLFCSELPLASLSLRGFEEKGNASLAGTFFPEIEAGIVPEKVDGKADLETQLIREPNVHGKLIIKSNFLPHWQTEPEERLARVIDGPIHNGVWHSTGMTGFLDDQKRFWLVRERGLGGIGDRK
jgi:acyl-coenzyme A synthetase/AMP-(fatty) acid ligase